MSTDGDLQTLIAQVVALVPPSRRRPPVTPSQVAAFQRAHDVALPREVLALLSTCDGFTEPTHPDRGWIEIWSLSRWQKISNLPFTDSTSEPEPLVFADHCLSSWWYAFDFASASSHCIPILLVDGQRQPFRVFDSLASFLRAILADDVPLYG